MVTGGGRLLSHSDVQVSRHLVDVGVSVYPASIERLCCRILPAHTQLFSTLVEPLTVIRGTDLSFCLCQTEICGADRGGRAVGPPLRSVLYRTSWRACSSLRRLWMRINVLRGKQTHETHRVQGLIEMGEGKLKDKISESLFQLHHITSKPRETKFLGCNVPSSACLQGFFLQIVKEKQPHPQDLLTETWLLKDPIEVTVDNIVMKAYLCHSLCCGVSSKMVWRNMQKEEKQLWGGKKEKMTQPQGFDESLTGSYWRLLDVIIVSARSRISAPTSADIEGRYKTWACFSEKDMRYVMRIRKSVTLTLAFHGDRDVNVYFQFAADSKKKIRVLCVEITWEKKLFCKTYLEKSLSTSYSYFIHVSLYTKNSRKARSAMALKAIRDTADETDGHVIVLFYLEKTKQTKTVGGIAHLFLRRPRSPRSSRTLWGRRPAPSPSSRPSCATDASSLRSGLSSTDQCQNPSLVYIGFNMDRNIHLPNRSYRHLDDLSK